MRTELPQGAQAGPDRPLGIAVVGLGMAAQPHLAALRDLAEIADVIWACSPSPERTQAFSAEYPEWPVTNDVTAAITDHRVEAVILLTPAHTHARLGIEILASGRHLLVEKPLDARMDLAEELVAAAKRSGTRLGVVLQHRFRPAARRLLELARSGELGEIAGAAMSVPWWRPQSYYDEPGRGTMERDGGGVLMTQAIHTLDLFRALAGQLRVRSAHASRTALHRMETEDMATALFDLPSGGCATMMATTASIHPGPETIELFGATGAARLSGNHLAVTWLDGRTEELGDSAFNAPTGPMDFDHGPHRDLIADFVRAVRSGREPECSGDEALATQRLINEILEAASFTPDLASQGMAGR